jgi:polyhydroxybutyrate depolymerase
LVLILHGGGGTGDGMERTLTLGGFNNLSDKHQFIAVYPDGYEKHWNDGRKIISDPAHLENLNDVGFIVALIENLTNEYHVNTEKVFVTGISNGAMMSFRLAIEVPNLFAAIAPVAGALPLDQIPLHNSSIPVSVCVISGTHDNLVPWKGGMVGTKRNPRGEVISIPGTIQYWVGHNMCNCTPENSILPDIDPRDRTRVYLDKYSNGLNDTEVFLYKIENGGHTWPGGHQYFPRFLIGRTCRDIDANEVIWDFFASHARVI